LFKTRNRLPTAPARASQKALPDPDATTTRVVASGHATRDADSARRIG
jgi:hypothetical protein